MLGGQHDDSSKDTAPSPHSQQLTAPTLAFPAGPLLSIQLTSRPGPVEYTQIPREASPQNMACNWAGEKGLIVCLEQALRGFPYWGPGPYG
jgi:hypothetical protein